MDNNYSKEIAATIVSQLGGNQFAVMTGAKKFTYSSDNKGITLRFFIGKNCKNVNMVRVIYNIASDTYSMIFSYVSKVFPIRGNSQIYTTVEKVINKCEDVYCDTIQEVFTSNTGMATKLF